MTQARCAGASTTSLVGYLWNLLWSGSIWLVQEPCTPWHFSCTLTDVSPVLMLTLACRRGEKKLYRPGRKIWRQRELMNELVETWLVAFLLSSTCMDVLWLYGGSLRGSRSMDAKERSDHPANAWTSGSFRLWTYPRINVSQEHQCLRSKGYFVQYLKMILFCFHLFSANQHKHTCKHNHHSTISMKFILQSELHFSFHVYLQGNCKPIHSA